MCHWYELISSVHTTHTVMNQALPNLSLFIKTILKREKLSEEAEGVRARYEAILTALEQGVTKRPVSIVVGEDDGGYFSGNRARGEEGGGVGGLDIEGEQWGEVLSVCGVGGCRG